MSRFSRPRLQHAGKAALAAVALIAALSAAPACGDGGDLPSATATLEGTPMELSPGAQATPSPPPGDGSPSIDLAATDALLTIYGVDSGDLMSDIPGLATGDFNDDGLADVLIGARFGDGPGNEREDAGEGYVVFGGAQLPAAVDLAAGEQNLTVYGESAGGGLGFAAAAGDVNADGVDDILVGAPFAAGAGRAGGTVYVIFGGGGLAGTVDTAQGQQDFTINGPAGNALFGDSLAVADVNGDGTSDIIIGSTFAADTGRQVANAGAVYVVFGSPALAGSVDTARNEQDVVIFAADEFDELGDTVASGDVNGDGIADIIATAEAADGPDNDRSVAAEVHVVFGRPDLGGVLRISEGDQDLSIYGAEENDTLGFNLGSGDVNGDGVADIIASARLADGPDNSRQQAGEVYIVFGGDDLAGSIDIAREEQDLTISGADPSDFFGSSIAVADIDGDGSPEAILGTGFGSGAANGRPRSGEAYIFGPLSAGGSLDIAPGVYRTAVYGARPGDALGSALAAGDVNGDGKDEIVVMATGAQGLAGTAEAGRIYVISAEPGS